MSAQALVRRATRLGSGTVLGQLAIVVAAPILTRAYGPSAFGSFGAMMSVAAILGLVSTLRLELAIPLPADDSIADQLGQLAIRAAGVISVAVFVLVAATKLIFEFDPLGSTAWLLAPLVWAIGIFNVCILRTVRRDDFGTAGRSRAMLGLATVGLQLALIPTGLDAFALALGPVAGYLAASAVLTSHGDHGPRASWAVLRETLTKYRRYPLFSVWSALFNRLALELPALVFIVLFGDASAGRLYLAFRITLLPANVITESLHQAFLHRAGRLSAEEPAALRSLTHRTVFGLGAIAIPGCMTAALIAPRALPALFGTGWEQTADYAVALLPLIATTLVVSPVASIMWITDNQILELGRNVIRFVLVAGAFALAFAREWSDQQTVWAYSLAMSVAQLLLLALVLRAAKHHTPENAAALTSADAVPMGRP